LGVRCIFEIVFEEDDDVFGITEKAKKYSKIPGQTFGFRNH
jgi:hypothetical protein